MAPKTKNGNNDPPKQHGVKGVYYGGDWLDIEDCDGVFNNIKNDAGSKGKCGGKCEACPRSRSRNKANASSSTTTTKGETYDVLIIGAGCIGAAIAREISKYCHTMNVLWVEAADDVSQGATKGNSGIVHAGYDDKPGTNHAKYCWKGNQMFAQLDKELRFGYQKNGSLVLAYTQDDMKHLQVLLQRGITNGVQRLRIIDNKDELQQLEPHVNPNAIGALYSPDAGNVIPYEYTIALAENAVDNGVELRIRREVVKIDQIDNNNGDGGFNVTLRYWEPKEYVDAINKDATTLTWSPMIVFSSLIAAMSSSAHFLFVSSSSEEDPSMIPMLIVNGICVLILIHETFLKSKIFGNKNSSSNMTMEELVNMAGNPEGGGSGNNNNKVLVDDMLVGGSGSCRIMNGITMEMETIQTKYIINCAGGASDQIANLINDTSFQIKPRIGDYLLLNRNQGHLARQTLFPCPDPILGKGVLVQTTLWGNLILGPTARDMHKAEAREMSTKSIQEYILSKCKRLVPSFDAKETFHAFNGARAKSDRGDWIIESSTINNKFIHVAGIDSPGLAGSPAIALEVIELLKQAGLENVLQNINPNFNPNRSPIITPKAGMRGLKMGPVGKNDGLIPNDNDEKRMSSNVICKCEKVTELEVVRALRKSLPIDSSQGIRKRTRAGMGHCQGDPNNYQCEARVRAIIARENQTPISHVGARPWPATSTLEQRWMNDEQKEQLEQLKNEQK